MPTLQGREPNCAKADDLCADARMVFGVSPTRDTVVVARTAGHGDKRRRSTIALLGSSSGRFKSSVEAIKAEAVAELAAVESGVPIVKVTAASLKKALGCATGQKWQARAAERFNREGLHANWSRGAAGAAAAALKVAG